MHVYSMYIIHIYYICHFVKWPCVTVPHHLWLWQFLIRVLQLHSLCSSVVGVLFCYRGQNCHLDHSIPCLWKLKKIKNHNIKREKGTVLNCTVWQIKLLHYNHRHADLFTIYLETRLLKHYYCVLSEVFKIETL